MFTPHELRKLSNLIDINSSPKEILDESESNIITSINLIKDSFFVPKHERAVKTIILKKLFVPGFNLADFVEQITRIVKPVFELRIGLSFIADKSADHTDMMYFFAIRPRPINNEYRFISENDDAKKLVEYLKPLSGDELLNFVFEQNNSLNPFDRSGFRPKKLVLAVFWITKFTEESDDEESQSD